MGIFSLPRPAIIAHRGYRKRYPENTLLAFEAAFDAGAHMIELDVTLSRDRRVVVIHDDTLNRTTSGKGKVGDFSVDELKRLDAGSWFDSRFAGERIPTLEEVLVNCIERGALNIEIKASAFEDPPPSDAIENQVLELVNRVAGGDRVIVSSLEHRFLERIAALNAPPPLALITNVGSAAEMVKICRRIKAFSCHPNHRLVDEPLVRMLHRDGIRVFPFTVNEPRRVRQMLGCGVDGNSASPSPITDEKVMGT